MLPVPASSGAYPFGVVARFGCCRGGLSLRREGQDSIESSRFLGKSYLLGHLASHLPKRAADCMHTVFALSRKKSDETAFLERR